ncbi:MAG: hypothetical protein IT449_02250 [Phycisphaerales bacterium]|nr:hypothetical protein [Phycisphaerales bacterium]
MSTELSPERKSLNERVQAVAAESHSAARAPWESLALTYAFAYGAGGAISEVLNHVRGQSNLLQSAVELAGAGSFFAAWDALSELYSGVYGATCLLLAWLAWRKRVSCMVMARWMCVLRTAIPLVWFGSLLTNYTSRFSGMAIKDRIWIMLSVVTSLLAPCIALWVLSRLQHGLARPARCIVGSSLILGGLDGTAWTLCNAGTLYGGGMFAVGAFNLDAVPQIVEGPVLLFLGIGVFRWRSVRHLAGWVLLLGTASRIVNWGARYAIGSWLVNRDAWITFAWAMCYVFLPTAWVAWRLRSILLREDRSPPGEPRCGVCEYNLTGNLSGICPECGTATHQDCPAPPSQTMASKPT